jgi:hypothetical protein
MDPLTLLRGRPALVQDEGDALVCMLERFGCCHCGIARSRPLAFTALRNVDRDFPR